MSDVASTLGVLYTLWQTDSGHVAIEPSDAPLVDRAMKEWAEKRRDAWLTLSTPDGATFSVLASTITSVLLSTAEERRLCTVREKDVADERAENRRLAGFVDSE